MDGCEARSDTAYPAPFRGGLRRFGWRAFMRQSREYPSAFDEVTTSPPSERQRKRRVNGNGNGGDQTISMDDFYAHMPTHRYIFAPCRQLWPARSVNARLGFIKGIAANVWLDEHRHVEQMTWAPGEPLLIEDRLISEGGWIVKPGCRTFNLYRPPNIRLGNSKRIEPWLNHLHCIYPDDAEHIVDWFAHRVQRPAEKINHALLLGGAQASGRILWSSRLSTQSALGILPKCRRHTCSAVLMALCVP
jgi:hypothetical protein